MGAVSNAKLGAGKKTNTNCKHKSTEREEASDDVLD